MGDPWLEYGTTAPWQRYRRAATGRMQFHERQTYSWAHGEKMVLLESWLPIAASAILAATMSVGVWACAPQPHSAQSAAAMPARQAALVIRATPLPKSDPTKLDLAAQPDRVSGPQVVIDSDSIALDGHVVGSTRAIKELKRAQRVVGLFDVLMQRRRAWVAANPGQAIPEFASLRVSPNTPGLVLFSVHRTMGYAGFPHIQVASSKGFFESTTRVAGLADPAIAGPCPAGTARPALHVEVDDDSWRLSLPREHSPLEARDSALTSSVEAFRRAADQMTSYVSVGAVVVHLVAGVTFARLAPFLAEAAKLAKREGIAEGVTFELNGFDTVAPIADNLSAACPDSDATGIPRSTSGSDPIADPRRAPFEKLINERRSEIIKCYELALARDPNAEGKSQTRIVIVKGGTVATVDTAMGGTLPPEMGPCLTGVFRAVATEMRFKPVVIVYPLTFSPGQ